MSLEWVSGRKELDPYFQACVDVYFSGEKVYLYYSPRLCSLPFSVKQIFFKNTKNNKMIYRMTCSYANKYTYIHIYMATHAYINMHIYTQKFLQGNISRYYQ